MKALCNSTWYHRFLALRIMRKKADEQEVKQFIRSMRSFSSQGEKLDMDAVLRITAAANKELFKIRKETNLLITRTEDYRGYGNRHPLRLRKVDNTLQSINDMAVLPSSVFHPYDYMSYEEGILGRIKA